jgi:hypothetical protein
MKRDFINDAIITTQDKCLNIESKIQGKDNNNNNSQEIENHHPKHV